MIFYFTGLPLCEDTEDITVPPVVTDVPYSIVPTNAKSVRVKSRNVMSAAEIHSSIPVLTVISLTLQLWDLFIKMDVMLAIIITLLQKSPPYRLLGFLFLKRLIFLYFLYCNRSKKIWDMFNDGCTDHQICFHHTYSVILLNIICIDRMLASLNNTLQILVGLVDVLVF